MHYILIAIKALQVSKVSVSVILGESICQPVTHSPHFSLYLCPSL